jgi:colicin import membrane protein
MVVHVRRQFVVEGVMPVRVPSALISSIALVFASTTPLIANDQKPSRTPSAAEALADKFAGGAEREAAKAAAQRKAEQDALRKAEEAEMLAAARAEAEARQKAEADTTTPSATAPSGGSDPELAALRARLAAARAKRQADRDKVAVTTSVPPSTDEPAVVSAPQAPAATPSPVEPEIAVDVRRPDVTREASPGRYAVLVVMTPGAKGIRRFDKSADPVLCLGNDCIVSAGADAASIRLPARKVLGPANTWGERAGACRQSLGCVFRNVELDLAAGARVQPVDMKVLVHDRREPQVVTADSACDVIGSRITCARAFQSSNYTMWIVPEAFASKAGPAALEQAVRERLTTLRSADAQPVRLQ